jgi:hypothetical protein
VGVSDTCKAPCLGHLQASLTGSLLDRTHLQASLGRPHLPHAHLHPPSSPPTHTLSDLTKRGWCVAWEECCGLVGQDGAPPRHVTLPSSQSYTVDEALANALGVN